MHCVYRDRLLTFSHIILGKNIWESRGDRVIMEESALYWSPRYIGPRYIGLRYNGVLVIKDRVIMESQCIEIKKYI